MPYITEETCVGKLDASATRRKKSSGGKNLQSCTCTAQRDHTQACHVPKRHGAVKDKQHHRDPSNHELKKVYAVEAVKEWTDQDEIVPVSSDPVEWLHEDRCPVVNFTRPCELRPARWESLPSLKSGDFSHQSISIILNGAFGSSMTPAPNLDEYSHSGSQLNRKGPLGSNEGAQSDRISTKDLTLVPNPIRTRRNANSGDTSDGDDLPSKPPNPPQGRVRRSEPRQVRYCCVYFGSSRTDVTTDCGTRKQYVSQLRRHHERHDFFYCTNCFNKFPSVEAREAHTESGLCVFTCVTENCHNYGTAPAFAQGPHCSHRRENPQKDQWRYLFRMARPNDELPSKGSMPQPGKQAPPSRPLVIQQPLPEFSASTTITQTASRQERSPLPVLAPAATSQSYDNVMTNALSADSDRVSSSASGRLVDTAYQLCVLAEKLHPVETSLDEPTRQTIDWIQRYTELSLQQLQTVALRIIPSSALDLGFPMNNRYPYSQNAPSAPQQNLPPRAPDPDTRRPDTPGREVLGFTGPRSPDSGDLGLDALDDFTTGASVEYSKMEDSKGV